MTRKLLLALLLLTFNCATLAASGLKVGMSADYPPVHFSQDGRIVGIEADNARAVGEIIGRTARIIVMPFNELIPALQSGQIDVIMSGMSVTPARSGEVTFTDSYLGVGQMAIIHRDKLGLYSQPWSVYRVGARVGVEPGTTGAAFAERELQDAKIVYYADADAAFSGLRSNEIDLYVHDAPTSWQLASSTENGDLISLYAPLTDEKLAWAVRRDNDALAAELNRALALMKANGTLQYILNRWIPVTIEVR